MGSHISMYLIPVEKILNCRISRRCATGQSIQNEALHEWLGPGTYVCVFMFDNNDTLYSLAPRKYCIESATANALTHSPYRASMKQKLAQDFRQE